MTLLSKINIPYEIVIVDADKVLNDLVCKNLEHSGYECRQAYSGAQAMETMKRDSKQIYILDYRLPDMNGKQLIEKLTEQNGQAPDFLLMTGYRDKEIALEMMNLGAKYHIIKEADLSEVLLVKLKRMLGGRKRKGELEATKAELEISKQDLQRLYQTMSDGVVYQNAKGEIISVNPPAERILGLTFRQMSGMTSMDPRWRALDENGADLPGEKHPAMVALEKGKKVLNFTMGVYHPGKNEHVWILVNAIPLFKNNDPKPYQAYTTFLDITEKKLAEDKQKESDEKYRTIFSNIQDVYYEITMDGTIVEISPSVDKIACLGYKRDQLIGMHYSALYKNPEDRAAVLNELQKNGQINDYEITFNSKDRDSIFCSVSSQIHFGKSGEPERMIGIIRDITDRKNTEKEIRQALDRVKISEERYIKSQKIGQIGSWEYNLDTETFWASDEGKRIYNLELGKTAFLREEVQKCAIPEDRERVNQALVDLINQGKRYDIVFSITPKNTSERKIIRSIAELQKDEHGKPLKIAGVLQDITELKNNEQALIEAKEKAEESDRLKAAFLSNISHEIRTPMNSIMGFANLLEQPGLSGEEQREFINIIQKGGIRMIDTMNKLMEISKIETGQEALKLSPVNVNEIMEGIENDIKDETGKKGLDFEVDCKLSERDIFIETDKKKFVSIMTYLINNAVKFTEKGFVKVGFERRENELHCFVRDSGIGIPEKHQKNIFDLFVQAEITNVRRYEGTGLGLSITKAYIERLGGQIHLKSEEGKGTLIAFTLPCYPETKETMQKEKIMTPIKKERNGGKIKILIAEDDEASFYHLSIILRGTAWEIIHAANGEEVVDLLKKHPDTELILMDLKMPYMNGYQATKAIRKVNKDIVILAQSAYALSDESEKAIEAGCNDYITKPINKEELMMKIKKWTQV